MSRIEIRLYKVFTSGNYELRVAHVGGSPDVTLSLNSGAPFAYAKRDAELLAVAIDCNLYLDDVLIRSKIGD